MVRHKLVEMQTRIHAARALVYDTAWRLEQAPRDPQFIAQALRMTKDLVRPHDAVLRRRSRADAGWRGLHARHAAPSASIARPRFTHWGWDGGDQ